MFSPSRTLVFVDKSCLWPVKFCPVDVGIALFIPTPVYSQTSPLAVARLLSELFPIWAGTGALSARHCRCGCAPGWAAARGALAVLCAAAPHSSPRRLRGCRLEWERAEPSPYTGHGGPRAAPQPGARSSDGTAQPTGRGMTFQVTAFTVFF